MTLKVLVPDMSLEIEDRYTDRFEDAINQAAILLQILKNILNRYSI